jgi:hypothetical protein
MGESSELDVKEQARRKALIARWKRPQGLVARARVLSLLQSRQERSLELRDVADQVGLPGDRTEAAWIVEEAMESSDAAPMRALEVSAEVVLTMRADGRALPTLAITTRAAAEPSAIRYGRAMALWCAAHTELMLEKWGDDVWNVAVPQRVAHRKSVGGYWTSNWAIYLECGRRAEVEVDRVYLAIKALRDVAGTLTEVFQAEHQTRATDSN